jgi:hypothetical protein
MIVAIGFLQLGVAVFCVWRIFVNYQTGEWGFLALNIVLAIVNLVWGLQNLSKER